MVGRVRRHCHGWGQKGSRDSTPRQSEKITRRDSGTWFIRLPDDLLSCLAPHVHCRESRQFRQSQGGIKPGDMRFAHHAGPVAPQRNGDTRLAVGGLQRLAAAGADGNDERGRAITSLDRGGHRAGGVCLGRWLFRCSNRASAPTDARRPAGLVTT